MRRLPIVDDATRARTRCAMCWGTLHRACLPSTCAHATCEACFKAREPDASCAVCGEKYLARGAPGAFARDAARDAECERVYGDAREAYDAEEDRRALRTLKECFGYETSTAFAARDGDEDEDEDEDEDAATRTETVDEDDGAYEIEFRDVAAARQTSGEPDETRARLPVEFASAPKTAKVEALRRFVEEQGRGKYALCDEHGRYRWSRADGSDKDSVLDPTKTLEDFFEPQLRRGEPIVAWFVSFRE
jgi:hypothetical protein